MPEYKVVSFIGQIKGGFFSSDGPHTASNQLQELIQSHVNQGWEFDRMGQIHILVKPGCIGGFLGQAASSVVYDQVIFKK